MKKFKRHLLFAILCLLYMQSYSQDSYFIHDASNEESLPFVKVYPNSGSPFLADIDGKIELKSNVTSFRLSYTGYKDTSYTVSALSDSILYMELIVQEVEQVTVKAGENPAHRIMNQVIANRKKNHPLGKDAFKYEAYSKFIFDINRDALAAIPDTTTDSTLMNMQKFFDENHLFLMESSSERNFQPPYRDREEIIAYRTSGFSDPMFSAFAQSLQSFSFYDNQFDLLGTEYINPIALGGIRRYLFIIEDTLVHQLDTTFTIFYRPRKGKTFDGLTGRMYINTNGYAIEKVTAAPYTDTMGLAGAVGDLTIVQEYELIDDRKWFPSKLSTQVLMRNTMIGADSLPNSYIVGKGSTYIKNVELNPEGKVKRDNNIVLRASNDAYETDNERWDSLRVDSATDREKNTYETLDSVMRANDADRLLKLMRILLSGKFPLGKRFDMDVMRLVNYNAYEGYRFGLGLETSERWMKNFVLGGYFGWATRDKEWKFGGFSTIYIKKSRGLRLDLKYQQDIVERGGTIYKGKMGLTDPERMRWFYMKPMDRQRIGELSLGWDVKANIEWKLFGNYQRISYTDDYRFLPSNDASEMFRDEYDLAIAGSELVWNIGEKYILIGDRKRSLGRKWPQIKIQALRSWKGWFESDYEFTRVSMELNQEFSIRGVGTWKLQLAAGMTDGVAPLTFQQNFGGTGVNWGVAVPNSFETMEAGSFYASRFANFYSRFDFRKFKTKASWNEPQIGLHFKSGYGDFTRASDHIVSFQVPVQGYYEAGLIFNGVLKSGVSSIGLGGFYQFGTFSSPTWYENIVPKITIGTTF